MTTLAVSIRGLRKQYGDVVAVDGLDLEVRTGECFGLLGPNGAGKTTTIEICEGLTAPDAGEVMVLGRRWTDATPALRERLGISLQETQFAEKLTVAETLNLFRSFYAAPRPLEEIIAAVQLGEKRKARVGQLSGGQKQRLALACALAGNPELFFLDEPTTGLDPQSRRQLWDLIAEIKAQGRTVVITTHYMDEAEQLCDRVAIVDHGRVIALGTPKALIASLGAEHVIEFATDPPLTEATALADVRGTVRPQAEDGIWRLQATALHEAIPALLARLQEHSVHLTELRTHTPTLEDVFVSLTGRYLRDG